MSTYNKIRPILALVNDHKKMLFVFCILIFSVGTAISADNPTLNQDIKLPLMMSGKQVGEVCVKAGTKVTVSARKCGKALVRNGTAEGWVKVGVFVGEEPKPPVIFGNDKKTVDSILDGWEIKESNRSTEDQKIYFYSKDVQVIVTFISDKAIKVEVIDRPGAGVSPIPETRFRELLAIIGKAPKLEDVKYDGGIREFYVLPDPPADVDLLTGTVFGKEIFRKTIEEVTDELGRPSKINRETDKKGVTTADLYYFELGVHIHFSKAPLRCSNITMILAQTHKPEGIYSQFKGTITKGVNANWKAKQVVEEFAQFKAADSFSQKMRDQRDELERVRKHTRDELEKIEIERAKLTGNPIRPVVDDGAEFADLFNQQANFFAAVRFKTQDNLFITINYEENTKFLESVDMGINLD